MWKRLLDALPALLRDAVGITGVAAVTYGVTRIYEPAGYIVGGMFLIAFALVTARGAA